MIAHNLLAWSAQIAALVALAAGAATLLRLRLPGPRLFYWQMVLLACLLLPLVRPWKQEAAAPDVSITMIAASRPVPRPAPRHLPPAEAGLWLLAAGALARAAWLAAGFWRLGRYRRRARLYGARDRTPLLLSGEITSPVTFGALRPVVMLPDSFPEWEPRVQEAVLCHELLHVRRRDWLFTVAEELIRTLLWFHPAVWWLLGQIQLAREQAVDREVVRRTRQRDDYVDTLLWIAGANPRPDLAPAPLFLRKQHLKQRVVSILEEVRMSRTRIVTSLAAALGIVAAACWLATAAFPLAAAPQTDAPGVTVTLHGAAVLHRAPVLYPPAALAKGVQGTVTLEATLDAAGEVTDARVLSGPQELRAAALQSVLQWHFQGDGTAGTRQVSVDFRLPPGSGGASAGSAAWPAQASAALAGLLLRNISIAGMPQPAADELRARLPLHEGDTLAADSIQQMGQALAAFDPHLKMVVRLGYRGVTDPRGTRVEKQVAISIAPASTLPPAPATRIQTAAESRLRVGGNAQASKLVFQVTPVYPPKAKQARVQGTVRLGAVIGKDGAVRNISVLSGDPALATSAVDAVKQWIYAPTLLNGQAVEVATEIDVNYTLAR